MLQSSLIGWGVGRGLAEENSGARVQVEGCHTLCLAEGLQSHRADGRAGGGSDARAPEARQLGAVQGVGTSSERPPPSH